MLMEPRTLVRMRYFHCVVCLCGLPIPLSLYSAAYWMWLEVGNGEANFVFFQCLIYNMFVAFLLVEFTRATLLRDKALRWTERNGRDAVVVLSPDGGESTAKQSNDVVESKKDQ